MMFFAHSDALMYCTAYHADNHAENSPGRSYFACHSPLWGYLMCADRSGYLHKVAQSIKGFF